MFEILSDFLSRNSRIELLVAITDTSLTTGHHDTFMTLLDQYMEWRKGDRIRTYPDPIIDGVVKVKTQMRRYRKFVIALRSAGLDMVYNKDLKSAELVEYLEGES